MRKTLLIGVGNEYRGDDAVGLIVSRLLAERCSNGLDICEQSGEGTELMETWRDAANVILIDAVSSGGRPGEVYRFEAHKRPLPTEFFRYSTHAFSVAEAVELARALGRLPSRLTIYGVEGEDFAPGAELSPKVEKAARDIAERIIEETGCRESDFRLSKSSSRR